MSLLGLFGLVNLVGEGLGGVNCEANHEPCFLYISDKKGTFHFHFSDKIHIKRNFLKKGTKWQSLVNSPVLSRPVPSRPPVLSCPVLSCPVLSCPVLSCPVLTTMTTMTMATMMTMAITLHYSESLKNP